MAARAATPRASSKAYQSRDEWVEANPLRVWRSSQNVSQPQLARELGVLEDTVRKWEHGRRHPSPPLMTRLAALTGRADLPTAWLAWRDSEKTLGRQWL